MNYQLELHILKKMKESILLKIHPDMWSKYKFGGFKYMKHNGRLAIVWTPIL